MVEWEQGIDEDKNAAIALTCLFWCGSEMEDISQGYLQVLMMQAGDLWE